VTQPNQYTHPLVNPRAGSQNLAAYVLNEPVVGISVAISPRELTTKNTAMPDVRYAINAPRAPAECKVEPEVRYNPVPTREKG
jgi:hypothetical protein